MIIISTKKSQILYDEALVDQADDHLFDPESWRNHGGLEATPAGRGAAWFLQGERHGLVLRHYRRGGMMARITEDKYLWSGREHSRPWQEFMILSRLHNQGLPVPQPVAARITRRGLFYRGDLITLRLDAHSLSTLATTPAHLPWPAIGACIRRFHDVGVCHADLNAHNILVNSHGDPYLIDFDKARIHPDGEWRLGNLARLRRSLQKLKEERAQFAFSEEDWNALRRGYGDGE